MVSTFLVALAVGVSAALALNACVDTEPSSSPFTVEVLTFAGNDATTGAGMYALRPVALPALLSVDPLFDHDFRFIAEPEVELAALRTIPDEAQLLAAVRNEASFVPRLRNIDNALVSRDLLSLQIVSAYAALRAAADSVPEATGLPSDAIIPADGLQVWVKPVFVDEAISSRLETNAFYLPYTNTFGLLDFSSLERRPLGALVPVVTHEFGHHLFHKSFTAAEGLCDDAGTGGNYPGRFAGEYAISGINEGFADWMAFVISGSTNTLIDAFVPELNDAGERAIDTRLPTATKFTFDSISTCTGNFYCIGTLFARSLFEAFVARGGDPQERAQRMAASRSVFAAVSTAPQRMRTRTWSRPNVICDPEPATKVDPAVLSGFLEAFVAGLPANERAGVCERFIANFGDLGFASEYRGACL